MLTHVIGVDSAGHTYNSQNENIERKLKDTEDLLREVIELMDNQTTLIVYGDHGMTDDGNHGGGSELELRTVFFAYQKEELPMYDTYSRFSHKFGDLDSMWKLSDIPATVSAILD